MKFLTLFKMFEEAQIRYLVAGGIAVNLHGVIRPTHDIDLIVYLEKKNLIRFIHLLTQLGYLPRVPVPAIDFADPKKRADWIKNKNMTVFSFYHPKDMMKIIDIFVEHPMPFGTLYKRRETIKVEDCIIPVVSIRDLIKLKQKADRLQDQSDVEALKGILEIKKRLSREEEKN